MVRREALSVESSAVQTDAWHHRSDVVTSLAAAIGISVALVGGKGYEAADDVAAALAATIIAIFLIPVTFYLVEKFTLRFSKGHASEVSSPTPQPASAD